MPGRFVPRAALVAAACILKLTTVLAQDPGPVADAAASPPAAAAGVPAPAQDPVATAALPLVTGAVAAAPAAAVASGHFELADRIVVRKSSRRLLLMQDDRVVAEYPVRLGLNPV